MHKWSRQSITLFHDTFTNLSCLCMIPVKGFEQEEKGIFKHWWASDKLFHWFTCSCSKGLKRTLNKTDIYLHVFNLIDKCSQYQQKTAIFHKLIHRYLLSKRTVQHSLIILNGIFLYFQDFRKCFKNKFIYSYIIWSKWQSRNRRGL